MTTDQPTKIAGRYTSALGDRRERAVTCTTCRGETYAFDNLCDRCFVDGLEDGAPLTITAADAGVMLGVDDSRFAGGVPAGTVGLFRGRHPNAELTNWLIVEVDAELARTNEGASLEGVQATVVVPLTAGMVTRAADR